MKTIIHKPGSFWTPERDKILRDLWLADAHSAGQIASLLGASSRNAVIGRVHRIGLPGKAGTARGKAKGASLGVHPRETAVRINNARKSTMFGQNTKGKPFTLRDRVPPMQISADPTPIPPPAADDIARVSFDELEGHHCRWVVLEEPAGPFVKQFCGKQRAPSSSYCPGHTARAFAPLRPRPQPIPFDSNVIVLKKRETVAA